MQQSNFVKWVNKFLRGIVLRTVELLNDSKRPLPYLHRRMLRKDFSVSGKWESLTSDNSAVMADVVAMDASIPLKTRDSVSTASGDIPKMGMKLTLNEKQLTDLDTIIAIGGSDNQVVAKLFRDTPRVITGVFERNEAVFLEGLSSGVTLVENDKNVGTGIRINYGYLDANKFGVTTLWSNTASKPFDDIDRVLAKASADGNTVTRMMLDKTAFDNMAKTTQAKELYAFSKGFVGTTIPTPDFSQMTQYISQRYNFVIELVDRSCTYEINGAKTTYKPWQDGAVVFVCDDVVGSLTWATLAEQNHPVENVRYETADEFILVSKYRQNEPSLTEATASQARVVPVISNVDRIYQLDSKTVQA